MSQIDYANTKEGIHQRAKEVNMKPWTLGCQCFDCCKEFDKIIEGNTVGMIRQEDEAALAADYTHENELRNKIWNAAIEAAELALHEKLKYPTEACAIIRGLKK